MDNEIDALKARVRELETNEKAVVEALAQSQEAEDRLRRAIDDINGSWGRQVIMERNEHGSLLAAALTRVQELEADVDRLRKLLAVARGCGECWQGTPCGADCRMADVELRRLVRDNMADAEVGPLLGHISTAESERDAALTRVRELEAALALSEDRINRAKQQLEEMPYGTIGAEGLTVEELLEDSDFEKCYAEEAMYHVAQAAWRTLNGE